MRDTKHAGPPVRDPSRGPSGLRRSRMSGNMEHVLDLAAMTTTQFNDDFRVLIGGSWADGANGSYPIINPATEEVVGEAPEASA